MYRRTRWVASLTAATMLSALGAAAPVRAAANGEVTAEALLRVLVRKGILTQQEASDVRTEAEREAETPAGSEVEALQKAQAATAKQVDALKAASEKAARTSVSGYIQARAVIQSHAAPENNIFVRRARLTLRHTTGAGRYQLTLDGGQNAVTIKDAFVVYNALPARGAAGPLALQMGAFIRPFGLELERASTQREFPERPAGWNVLFPGVWDQGASASYAPTADTSVTLALLNGPGSGLTTLPYRDPDNYKDVLARVRYTLRAAGAPKAEFAISGYKGKQRVAGSAAVPAQTGFADTNGNGRQDPDEPTVILAPGKAAVPAVTGDRDRFGLAASVYNVAGGDLRTEYIRARDLTANLAAGPRLATAPAEAYYLLYTHPLKDGITLGARYDAFDPDTRDRNRPDGDGEVRTFGLVALRDFTENIRITLAYERPRTTRYDAAAHAATTSADDVLTLQGQYRF